MRLYYFFSKLFQPPSDVALVILSGSVYNEVSESVRSSCCVANSEPEEFVQSSKVLLVLALKRLSLRYRSSNHNGRLPESSLAALFDE